MKRRIEWVVVLVLLTWINGVAGETSAPSPLLAIDQHRATVIDRVVTQWGNDLTASTAGLSLPQLREMLMGLRADHLLAASLAGSLTGLRDVLAQSLTASTAVKPALFQTKALGDAADDLVYTPVSPCRLFDTRPSQGGLGVMTPNVRRTYGATTPVANQGGPGSCNAPVGAAVALIQIGSLTPSGNGFLQGGAQGIASFPNALILYQAGDQYGTAVAMPLNVANGRFDVQVQFAATDLYGDLLGYFKAPSGAGNFFVQGGNTFGTIAKLGTLDFQPLEIYAGSLRVMRYEPVGSGPNIIGGHSNNSASGGSATVAGGGSPFTCEFGGSSRACANAATAEGAFVGGGFANVANGLSSLIAGGFLNTSSGDATTIGGGRNNTTATAPTSTVAGGASNTASGNSSTVGGGVDNTANGFAATVPGGRFNVASGQYSFAAGLRAKAIGDGTFVFGDSSNADVTSSADNQFIVAASNNIIMAKNKALSVGCFMPGSTWSCTSDRNMKRDISDVDAQGILQKVAAMPISSWRYEDEPNAIRHVGPMSQDFHSAFGLGHDDKTISMVDGDGIALAAIQGLHQVVQQVVQQKDARIAALEKAVEELKRVVEALGPKQ